VPAIRLTIGNDFTLTELLEIILHLTFDDRSQQVETQNIRQRHREDHAIRKVQDCLQLGHATQRHKDTEDHIEAIARDFAGTKNVDPPFKSVVGPGDHGREGKEKNDQRQHVGEPWDDAGKGR
jgi:hypothetical protein